MDFTVQTLKFCDKIKKSQLRIENSNPPPHIFQMVIDYENVFIPLNSEYLKMGGRSLQNPKKKTIMNSKCPCNPKTQNLEYLTNHTLLGENKPTTSIRTLENVGVGHLETFKFYNNEPLMPSSIRPP